MSKQIILNDFLIKNNIQILSINETHLKPKHFFELEGYNIYRKDRIDRRKGGVALVIAKSLNQEVLTLSSQAEIVAVKITFENKLNV